VDPSSIRGNGAGAEVALARGDGFDVGRALRAYAQAVGRVLNVAACAADRPQKMGMQWARQECPALAARSPCSLAVARRTLDNGAVVQEDRGADAELAVGGVGVCLGLHGPRDEGVDLGRGERLFVGHGGTLLVCGACGRRRGVTVWDWPVAYTRDDPPAIRNVS